jgi:hypothetical protein
MKKPHRTYPCKALFGLACEMGYYDKEGNNIEVTILAESYQSGFYCMRLPTGSAENNSGIPGAWYEDDGSLILSYVSDEYIKFI